MAIGRLLVAARGEIAARVIRTCDRLGIETVAIAATDDRGAYHTRGAGHVHEVAGYLDGEDVIRVALESGADAVHPGYGFLAERAEFAEAVEAAALEWVGPPPHAMRLAGDKLAAKRIAREAGVPTVPFGAPEDVGFPLILKAAAGGGGRGMRIVHDPALLDAEVEAANREARAAFGDGAVFAERLVDRARHVEVQLLGDRLGNLTVLGTRDCSIQRRYQKVFEEAPAPGIEAIGPALDEAALAIGRAAGYQSAGTAEFLVSGSEFWFIELNARLQVEHPITEAVTGIDLVAEQLRIANGEAIGPAPTEDGHSLEARLYAEHPTTFLPQAGRIERLELPGWIRVDAGVEAGDEIPVAYDPLIAKLVVHAETRTEAFDEMASALAETRVGGVTTNLALQRWIVAHPVVRAGAVSTSFLDEYPPLSRPTDPTRPWSDGWRLNGQAAQRRPPPRLAPSGARSVDGRESTEIRAPMPGRVIQIVVAAGDRVAARQPMVLLEAMKMETPISAPHDAVVSRIAVAAGDHVAAGDLLVEVAE